MYKWIWERIFLLVFLFGDFLGRAETIFIKKTETLSKIDMIKQVGIISGMIISILFYNILENLFEITENAPKVFYIHFLLCFIEIIIVLLLIKAFEKETK